MLTTTCIFIFHILRLGCLVYWKSGGTLQDVGKYSYRATVLAFARERLAVRRWISKLGWTQEEIETPPNLVDTLAWSLDLVC